jgi:hypothetical protein
MRSRPRHRGPGAKGIAILGLGLFGFVVLPVAAGGCGRIGYDPLPEVPADGAPRPRDATADVTADGDATQPSALEASDEAATDAAPDGVPDAEDGPADGEADAESGCATTAAVDYCQSVPPLPAPPVIDGVLDCGPTPVPIVPEDWRGAAPLPPFPPGNSAQVAAAWRPDGLYVFIAVTTPVVIPADPAQLAYYGAGVEVFVDGDGLFTTPGLYDVPGTIQVIVPSPPYDPADASATVCPVDAAADADDASDGGASEDAGADAAEAAAPGRRAEVYRNEADLGAWTSSQFGTFPTATGFVFEGFFVAADLGLPSLALAAGGQVGFDFAVDVSFPDYCTTGLEGHRAGQYFMNVATTAADAAEDAAPIGPPFADTRSFCTPTLAGM